MLRRLVLLNWPGAFAVLAWILSSVPGTSRGQDDSRADTLRVMSFNVRLGVAQDGDNAWANRRELLAATVRAFDPDLLGTQETYDFQADYLQEQLPGYAYVGWSRRPGVSDEHCGILYRQARFDRLGAGQFWLSERPDEAGSQSWDSSLPRIVTWVHLRQRDGARRELFFFNTHFDHRGPEARLESAKLLRRKIGELAGDRPFVVTGDFNCGADSDPYQALIVQDGSPVIVDTYPERENAAATNAEQDGTFHGFRGTRGGARIDWVLRSPHLTTADARIDRTQRDGRYPSDHYPVAATLKWNQEN